MIFYAALVFVLAGSTFYLVGTWVEWRQRDE